MPSKSWKNHLKKLLTLAEILSFQKFFITAQTAKMADFMFQNMAYRATVYRTGGKKRTLVLCDQETFFYNIFHMPLSKFVPSYITQGFLIWKLILSVGVS